jgi:hypothetical protein
MINDFSAPRAIGVPWRILEVQAAAAPEGERQHCGRPAPRK